jgi:hypothetical protein
MRRWASLRIAWSARQINATLVAAPLDVHEQNEQKFLIENELQVTFVARHAPSFLVMRPSSLVALTLLGRNAGFNNSRISPAPDYRFRRHLHMELGKGALRLSAYWTM